LELIGRLKVSKVEVARRFVHTSALWGFRLCHEQELDEKEALIDSIKDVLNDQDRIPDSEYQRQLARFRSIQEERRLQRGTARSMELYPPGRILHLAKTGERRSCAAGIAKIVTCCMTNAGSEYVPVWINNDDLNEIVVSPTMGTDHFPNRVRDILEDIAEDFGLV
jgi:sn1-specific diacylglycerol lipase